MNLTFKAIAILLFVCHFDRCNDNSDGAGGTTLDRAKLDGVSLLPLLSGKSVDFPHRNLFWRVGKKNALRSGDWKIIRVDKEWQLYDLARDVGETTNLAAKEPARVQQLDAMWNQWNSEQTEPLWN